MITGLALLRGETTPSQTICMANEDLQPSLLDILLVAP